MAAYPHLLFTDILQPAVNIKHLIKALFGCNSMFTLSLKHYRIIRTNFFNMKKLYTFILLVYSISAGAQSTTPTVVASSGGFFSNTAGMLSFTVGELAAVTTLSSPNNYLTQGFQQPSDFGVFVPPVKDENFSVSVFPNPSTGLFNLSINASSSMTLQFSLYDMLGKKIIAGQKNLSRGKNLVPVDLRQQVTGMYLLECTFINLSNGEQNKAYSKLHLIY